MTDSNIPEKLISRLARARRVVVLTGAGISAESGVPTFRDPGGLWQKFKPEELANVEAFLRNPELVQGWYRHRRAIVRDVHPNAWHDALARLQEMVPEFTLVTQNVDNLHQRAGSRDVIELHGNIMRSYCIDCRKETSLEGTSDKEAIRCESCGGLIRPDVVWFGEMLPVENFERADRESRRADLFLSIGTSGLVYPAAGLPLAAAEAGAYVVEINIEPSAIARYLNDVVIGRSGEVLPRVLDAVDKLRRDAA
jgi:NAD-dependent deacetylase